LKPLLKSIFLAGFKGPPRAKTTDQGRGKKPERETLSRRWQDIWTAPDAAGDWRFAVFPTADTPRSRALTRARKRERPDGGGPGMGRPNALAAGAD